MKKAFTIIEILAIIVIMAVILAVILPNINGINDKQKQNEYNKILDRIYLSADTYLNAKLNNETYPIKIKLQELADEGYISSKLINPLTEEELDYEGYILITKELDNTLTFNYPDETDIEEPTIMFSPNGSLKYKQSSSVKVMVNDDIDFQEESLRYKWTTSISTPNEGDFIETFENNSLIPMPSGANGTYYLWILVKDMDLNNIIKSSNKFNIDSIAPTVVFETNGSTGYVKTASTKVTVNDNLKVNTNSLKYLWTTSTSTPSDESFVETFTNESTVSSPSGVTGSYYLWIYAEDEAKSVAKQRSNVFNIDGIAPVITMNGSTPITIKVGDTYTDLGASATDNIDPSVSVSTTSTVVTTSAGTYTVTYNATDSAGNNATPVVRTVIVETCGFYAVGNAGNYGYGYLYKYTYNGSSWATVQPAGAAASWLDVSSIDKNGIYAIAVNAATNGPFSRYLYNGSSWVQSIPMTGNYWVTSSATDESNFYAIGGYGNVAYGRFFKYTYNGSSWSYVQPIGTQYLWLDVSAINESSFYVTGNYDTNAGYLFKYTYNGSSWVYTQPAGTARYWVTVSAIDENNFYAIGGYGNVAYGYLYKFTYNGSSWTSTQPAGTAYRWVSVSAIDENNFYAIGNYGNVNYGYLYKFTYNGSSWTSTQPAGTAYRWGDVSAIK